jgi:hypothetical protein
MFDGFDVLLLPSIEGISEVERKSLLLITSSHFLSCSNCLSSPLPSSPVRNTDLTLIDQVSSFISTFFLSLLSPCHVPPPFHSSGGWFYKRGAAGSGDGNLGTKFVNSGCIVGRVLEMRNFLRESLRHMKSTHDDDQLSVMEYLFQNPHIVSVDHSNQIFLCLYKFLSRELSFNSTLGELIIRQQRSKIGLLHFNSGMVSDLSNK